MNLSRIVHSWYFQEEFNRREEEERRQREEEEQRELEEEEERQREMEEQAYWEDYQCIMSEK